MLISPTFFDDEDGRRFEFYTELRSTENLPVALQFWTGYVARELLILGVFFRAAAIMLQVPGAGDYRLLAYDDQDDDLGNRHEDPSVWVGAADRNTVFNVLAFCLASVGVDELVRQVPGGRSYKKAKLSAKWKAYIKAQLRFDDGLLNIIAECLDELMVRPGIAEINQKPQATWWQQWWAQME